MKVLQAYVLVEQTTTEKNSKIITTQMKNEADKFNFSFKVIDKGPECKIEGIQIGDSPVFRKHVQFEGIKAIVGKGEKKDENGSEITITHVLVHEGDIIAIDNDANTEGQKM